MNKLQLAVISIVFAAIVASFAAFAPVQAQSNVVCLDTAGLVTALGTYPARVKFDLMDDQHHDPAGWRVIYDGNNPISWVVPEDYVVQYGDPMTSFTGNGTTEITFFAASIWMPWQCRTNGETPTPEPSETPSPTMTPSPTAEPTETNTPEPAYYSMNHYVEGEVTYLEFACGDTDLTPEMELELGQVNPAFPSVIIESVWEPEWQYSLCGGAIVELLPNTVQVKVPGNVMMVVSAEAADLGWQTMDRWFWLEGYMPDELKPTPTPSPTPEPTAEPTPSPTPIPEPGQFAPVKDWAEYLGWIFHGLVDPPMGYQVEVFSLSTLPIGYKAVGTGIVIERSDTNRTMPPGWYTVYGFENVHLPFVVR